MEGGFWSSATKPKVVRDWRGGRGRQDTSCLSKNWWCSVRCAHGTLEAKRQWKFPRVLQRTRAGAQVVLVQYRLVYRRQESQYNGYISVCPALVPGNWQELWYAHRAEDPASNS